MERRMRLNAILAEAKRRQRQADTLAAGSRESFLASMNRLIDRVTPEKQEGECEAARWARRFKYTDSEEGRDALIRELIDRAKRAKREQFKLTGRYW